MCSRSRYSGYHIRLVSLGSSPGSATNLHVTLGSSLNISEFMFFTCKVRGLE